MPIRIHKEGKASILIALILFLFVSSLAFLLFAFSTLFWILTLPPLLLLLFFLHFFRHPKRVPPDSPNIILAPCDGKIVAIEEIQESHYFHKPMWQVSIFMSPLNVHVNYAPISGKVKYCQYFPGKYLVAWHPKSSSENEQTFIVIENHSISIGMKQIAGAVARRIKCYVKPETSIRAGDEIGFIKFGSRVDLLIPTECLLLVSLNQKTKGALTPIAKFSS